MKADYLQGISNAQKSDETMVEKIKWSKGIVYGLRMNIILSDAFDLI